jgi:hypothetical protein
MASATELYPEFRLLLSLREYVHEERQHCPMYTDVERERYRELGVVQNDLSARLEAVAKKALDTLGITSKPFS